MLVPALVNLPAFIAVGPFGRALVWALYGLLLNLLIAHEIGYISWYRIFGLACFMAVFTVLTGASIDALIHFRNVFRVGEGLIGFTYLTQMFVLLSVFPFTLFFAQCFPASEIIDRVSFRRSPMTFRRRAIILGLRVVTHVFEVVPALFTVWLEEMPALLIPRASDKATFSFLGTVMGPVVRVWNAVEAVCLSLLCQTFYPIPSFIWEIIALKEVKGSK